MSKEPGAETAMTGAKRDAPRYLRLHLRVYVLAAMVLFLVDLTVSDGWWFLWPVLIWGALVALHQLYVKVSRVDDEWAERRARDVAERAYDVSHIEAIRQRHEGKGENRAGD